MIDQESRFLWNTPETQDYLQSLIRNHIKWLDERPTPQNEKHSKVVVRRASQWMKESYIDGIKLFELLMETGGFDSAWELYGKYHGAPGWRDSELPQILDIADELKNMPDLSPEIISGILRRGHKMLIAGGSKTSKSFLSLELAVAVATGSDWIGTYPCGQGRVLYVNGEIDRASCDRRIAAILDRLKIDRDELRGKMSIVTLREVEVTTDQLAGLIDRSGGFDMIIIDPIYTMGDVTDENNAAEVRRFLKEIGRLSAETGAAVVCIHHHSKGQQGGKRAIDRASGSGVFGRWYDAVIDLSALHIPEGVAEQSRTPESVPMRLEFDLRDFKQPKPLSIWWHYPIHIPDASGDLDGLLIDGDPKANLKQYQSGQSEEQRQAQNDADMTMAINAIVSDGREPSIRAVADELHKSEKTIRTWLEKSSEIVRDGKILKREVR